MKLSLQAKSILRGVMEWRDGVQGRQRPFLFSSKAINTASRLYSMNLLVEREDGPDITQAGREEISTQGATT